MRTLVINRLLKLKQASNGFGPGTEAPTYWEGFKINGIRFADVDLESLSDSDLIRMFEEVVTNFEYMAHN